MRLSSFSRRRLQPRDAEVDIEHTYYTTNRSSMQYPKAKKFDFFSSQKRVFATCGQSERNHTPPASQKLHFDAPQTGNCFLLVCRILPLAKDPSLGAKNASTGLLERFTLLACFLCPVALEKARRACAGAFWSCKGRRPGTRTDSHGSEQRLSRHRLGWAPEPVPLVFGKDRKLGQGCTGARQAKVGLGLR